MICTSAFDRLRKYSSRRSFCVLSTHRETILYERKYSVTNYYPGFGQRNYSYSDTFMSYCVYLWSWKFLWRQCKCWRYPRNIFWFWDYYCHFIQQPNLMYKSMNTKHGTHRFIKFSFLITFPNYNFKTSRHIAWALSQRNVTEWKIYGNHPPHWNQISAAILSTLFWKVGVSSVRWHQSCMSTFWYNITWWQRSLFNSVSDLLHSKK